MCEPCKRRLNSLEKSAEDLQNFRKQAKRSRELFSSRETLKRSKETSSDFVSPDTRKEKPPSKRISVPVGRRLDFGVQSSSSQGEFTIITCVKFKQLCPDPENFLIYTAGCRPTTSLSPASAGRRPTISLSPASAGRRPTT
jgi:hypothetical protein